jgi:hypothetical protein
MDDKDILIIKFKYFDKPMKECREYLERKINTIESKNETFIICMINNKTSDVNKIKNMSNVIFLSNFLNNVKPRIKKIKIYGRSSTIDFAVGIIKSLLKYNIEHIVEYVDYIE